MVKKNKILLSEAEIAKEAYLVNRHQENPFVGTEYEAMFDANPYKDMYYDPSFWDTIGLSNKAKDANAEYDRLYNEYIAGIYDQQRQDQYNSPSAEAQRMRAAGLNPDLAGLTGDSNTSGMTPPNAGPMSALNGVSPASQALSTFTSILGFATGTLKQIQEIKGLSLGNDASRLKNLGDLMNFAKPHIVSEYARRFSGREENNWSEIAEVSSAPIPAGMRDDYKKAFNNLLSSSQFTASEAAWRSLSDNERSMRIVTDGMVKLSLQAQKAGDLLQINKSWLNQWRTKVYSRLYDEFEKGSLLAGLMIIGMNSSLPNIFGTAFLGSQDGSKPWNRGINWNDSFLEGVGKLGNLL